jgi:ubiquinone/menaquinone biosynthesis C-methylase UbiE
VAEVARSFDDGDAYERFMGAWSLAAGTTFLDWLRAPRGARWLDVGCGTGVFTELVLNRCFPATVTAVDPASAQLEFARRKPTMKGADLRVADAQALPFSNASFDVVASALVINFIPDRPRAIVEMCRVCRPGGIVGGYVWDFAEDGAPNLPICRGMMELGIDPPPVPGTRDSRQDAMRSLFDNARLEDIEVRTIDATASFTDFDEYWHSQMPSYSPVTNAIAELPEADRAKLIETVRASLPPRPDGSIVCSARANAIKARVPD